MMRANGLNRVELCGRVGEAPCLDHQLYGECFYTMPLEVPRLSGVVDVLPVTLPGRCAAVPQPGDNVFIQGQLRSYNKRTENGSRLIITVFAYCVEHSIGAPVNEVELSGYLCKPVLLRTTPFMREIGDLLLAVNRSFNKSDYLPCIAWGQNAHIACECAVGSHLRLRGRLQSRQYQKCLDNGDICQRTAYEVSCSEIELLE